MMEIQEYDDNYSTCEWTHATLAIYHDDLKPEEVTDLLGVTPTETQRKGEPRPKPQEKQALVIGAWFLDSEGKVKSYDVRRHIDWALGQVVDKADIFEKLRQEGCRTELLCGWFSAHGHGGPMISPSQSKMLGSLGLLLSFDCYFTPERDFEEKENIRRGNK